MKHSLVKMTTPAGETVEIPEAKVEKMLNRGYEMKTAKPAKTTEPEEVQDSHEEIEQNEEEV